MEERRMKEISELEVRRYFDNYLQTVFPEQVKALRHHTHTLVEAHNASRDAHGGVERKFNRLVWVLFGASLAIGGGAGAIVQSFLGG